MVIVAKSRIQPLEKSAALPLVISLSASKKRDKKADEKFQNVINRVKALASSSESSSDLEMSEEKAQKN